MMSITCTSPKLLLKVQRHTLKNNFLWTKEVSSLVLYCVIDVETFPGTKTALCTAASGSPQAVEGLTEVSLPCGSRSVWQVVQQWPNGGLITHCLPSTTGPLVPPAIWLPLLHCLSHSLQLWDEGESVKEIKIGSIKSRGTGRRKGLGVVVIIILKKMCMLSSLSNLTLTTKTSPVAHAVCLVLSETLSSKQLQSNQGVHFHIITIT